MATDYSDYYIKDHQIILIVLFLKIIKKFSILFLLFNIINKIGVQYFERFLCVTLHSNCIYYFTVLVLKARNFGINPCSFLSFIFQTACHQILMCFPSSSDFTFPLAFVAYLIPGINYKYLQYV